MGLWRGGGWDNDVVNNDENIVVVGAIMCS